MFNDFILTEQIINTIKFSLGILFLLASIISIRKEPRRILNGLLIFLGFILTFTGTLNLSFPNFYSASGAVTLGKGSELTFLLFLLMLLLIFIIGLGLCINGLKVLKAEKFSLAHALPLIFGFSAILLPFIFAGITFIGYTNQSLTYLTQILFWITMYVPGMVAVFLLYSVIYALLPKNYYAEYILVLGAGLINGEKVTPLLASRLDKAIRVYNKNNQKSLIIVSGGKGDDEKVSEAFAMREYLLEQSIPNSSIILEDQSTNTYENFKYSKKIMLKQNKDYSCVFVTSNFHVLRAAILAKTMDIKADGIGSKTALYYLPSAFIREYIAIVFKYKTLALAYIATVILLTLVLP